MAEFPVMAEVSAIEARKPTFKEWFEATRHVPYPGLEGEQWDRVAASRGGHAGSGRPGPGSLAVSTTPV